MIDTEMTLMTGGVRCLGQTVPKKLAEKLAAPVALIWPAGYLLASRNVDAIGRAGS